MKLSFGFPIDSPLLFQLKDHAQVNKLKLSVINGLLHKASH